MITYRIKDWDTHYEKNHKDSEVVFRWIALPTKHDGKGFRRIARLRKKCEVFCAWILILQTAAKTPVRGILADETGPLTAQDLSDATGFPESIFEFAFKMLSQKDIGWLEEVSGSDLSGLGSDLSGSCPPTEQNRTEQNTHTSGVSKNDSIAASGFERFWNCWPKHPRKTNRAACEKRWTSASLEPLAEEILLGLNRWKASAQWQKDRGQFVPAPLVWLNQERWTSADTLDPATRPVGQGDNVYERKPTDRELAETIGMPWPVKLADGTVLGD